MKNKSKVRKQLGATWFMLLAVMAAMIAIWFVVSGTIHEQSPTPTPSFSTMSSIVTNNAQWTPRTQAFNGVDMVLVPPGCFIMGTENPPPAGYSFSNEKPTTRICFDKLFWIDKDLVTNAQFAQFKGKAANSSHWISDQLPRESITWFEARDFCTARSVGVRLPTEAEWEYAARGPDNLAYPWGKDFTDDKAVYAGNSATPYSGSHTADVESKPGGVSWVGAFDMAGNVAEWISSIYKPYPYSATDGRESNNDNSSPRVTRGGAFNDDSDGLRSAFRSDGDPSEEFDFIGFRCAHS